MNNRYMFNDLVDEIRVTNNLLRLAGIDLAYTTYHSNNKTCVDCGSTVNIERWAGVTVLAPGTPAECRSCLYEHLANYLLERAIAKEAE